MKINYKTKRSMQGQSKKKKLAAGDIEKLGKKIKSFDMFGKGVGFNIGEG